ncbi:DUF1382 family protein [Vreelandella venusta]|uniref:DUF1382 family protein n=1 Tax=Vreelandella venusta TaxID=44935 RepID=UPI00384C8B14
MNRASPVEMRKALEAAEVYRSAGILFVPMPVFRKGEKIARQVEAYVRLAEAADEAERSSHGY